MCKSKDFRFFFSAKGVKTIHLSHLTILQMRSPRAIYRTLDLPCVANHMASSPDSRSLSHANLSMIAMG